MTQDAQPYALMSELLDSLNVGLCLFDEADRTLLWNRSFLKLFPEHDGHVRPGESYADNLRRFYLCRLSEEELPLIDRYIEEGVRRHRSQSQPFVFQHRGQWLRVASTPVPRVGRVRVWTPLASPTGAVSWQPPSHGDGTEGAGDGAGLMDGVADGLMLLDADRRIRSVNEQILFLYDVPRKADIIGLRYEDLLARIGLDEAGAGRAGLLTERQRFTGAPFEVRLPNDRWIRVAEQRGVDGTAYSTHVDITEMKRMQAALNRAKEEADRANAAKSRFLAMISHEIRTPMNAIIGIARIAQKGAQDPALRGYLTKIASSAGLLLGVINDLLDFSKIEAGKMEIVAQRFRLDDVLEPLFDSAFGRENRGVERVLRVGPGVPVHLLGDPLRLGQILTNLVGNAVKFTDRGEIAVTVALAGRTAGRVRLDFTVSDTGIGMAPAQLDRLFEPFVQADATATRKYGGTGLGLTICRQLVSLMGGDLTVESTQGRGSRFAFSLTFAVAEPDTAEPAPAPRPGAGTRVLVVDDQPAARGAVAAMARDFGFDAVEAASGPEAVALAEHAAAIGKPFAMAFVDQGMPGWSGLESLRRMRQGRFGTAAPAFLMTAGDGSEEPAEPGRATLYQGVLHKPVGRSRLRECLTRCLIQYPGGTSGSEAVGAAEGTGGPAAWSDLAGLRVLLVEDNALNREVALHLLADVSVTAEMAENGLEAVRLATGTQYDVILMDIQMPVMDGLEATRLIRRLPQAGRTPVIAMTAQAMEEQRRACLEAGMDDLVTKPVDPSLLYAALARFAGPSRRRPAVSTAPTIGRPSPDWSERARKAGLDWEGALARVEGDRAVLHKVLAMFCRDSAAYPAELRAALADGRIDRLKAVAHILRSTAGYIGAAAISALAASVEQAAARNEPQAVVILTASLADSLDALLGQLSG